jgi:hypothetical protein
MKVGEFLQRVKSLYNKGVQSDDNRLTDRHIYNKGLTVRSKLLSQESKKKQKLSQWNFQELPCVELIKVDRHECSCLPNVGCEILRTKHKLPDPLVGLSAHMIEYVTSLDGSIIYSETTWKGINYRAGNKYTSHKPDYWIQDGFMYINNKNGPKIIRISGLWEDPIKAEGFPSYCGGDTEDENACIDPRELPFPIDEDMMDTLIELTIKELIGVFSAGAEDVHNDTKDTRYKN